mgnify:CR=1 FL=1
MVTANPLLAPAVNDYQTTMFDVSSKFYPNGGAAISTASNPLLNATSQVSLNSTTTEGDISLGDKIYYIDTTGTLIDTTRVVVIVPTIAQPSFITDANIAAYTVSGRLEFVFNANPYYKDNFSGDSEFLKDKFVRFSYRFQFDDNEYSIFAPFTQPAFIPEQDGYFMYTGSGGSQVNPIFPENLRDEEDTYRSTIVDFMENKVTKIDLRIPLPATKAQLFNKFKARGYNFSSVIHPNAILSESCSSKGLESFIITSSRASFLVALAMVSIFFLTESGGIATSFRMSSFHSLSMSFGMSTCILARE